MTLAPCPRSPNCVSSLADQTDTAHRIEPLFFSDGADRAHARLLAAIRSLPRARIVRDAPLRIEAEVKSRLFGFVDDLVCVIDAEAQRIDLRSAARLGWSDLGVNRRRVELLRRVMGGEAR